MLRWLSPFLLLIAAAPQAAAAEATICDRAAAAAAQGSDVPLAYLRALTRTETGRGRGGALSPWPWTVNMEGAGRWFDTRAEALAYVRERHRRGARSFDIGCFQINYRWHGKAFDSIEAMFDPFENARYAAAFLTELRREGGGWPRAVGRYHSRTPKFAKKYRKRFERILASLSPADADAPPAPVRRAPAAAAPVSQAVATPLITPVAPDGLGESARALARLAFLTGPSGGALVPVRQLTTDGPASPGGVALMIGGASQGLLKTGQRLLN